MATHFGIEMPQVFLDSHADMVFVTTTNEIFSSIFY